MVGQDFYYLCRHPNVFRVPTRDEPLLTHALPLEILDPPEAAPFSKRRPAQWMSVCRPPSSSPHQGLSFRVTSLAFHPTEDLFALALAVTAAPPSPSPSSSPSPVFSSCSSSHGTIPRGRRGSDRMHPTQEGPEARQTRVVREGDYATSNEGDCDEVDRELRGERKEEASQRDMEDLAALQSAPSPVPATEGGMTLASAPPTGDESDKDGHPSLSASTHPLPPPSGSCESGSPFNSAQGDSPPQSDPPTPSTSPVAPRAYSPSSCSSSSSSSSSQGSSSSCSPSCPASSYSSRAAVAPAGLLCYSVIVLGDTVTRAPITSWRVPAVGQLEREAASGEEADRDRRQTGMKRTERRERRCKTREAESGVRYLSFTSDGNHLVVMEDKRDVLFLFRLPAPFLLLHPSQGILALRRRKRSARRNAAAKKLRRDALDGERQRLQVNEDKKESEDDAAESEECGDESGTDCDEDRFQARLVLALRLTETERRDDETAAEAAATAGPSQLGLSWLFPFFLSREKTHPPSVATTLERGLELKAETQEKSEGAAIASAGASASSPPHPYGASDLHPSVDPLSTPASGSASELLRGLNGSEKKTDALLSLRASENKDRVDPLTSEAAETKRREEPGKTDGERSRGGGMATVNDEAQKHTVTGEQDDREKAKATGGPGGEIDTVLDTEKDNARGENGLHCLSDELQAKSDRNPRRPLGLFLQVLWVGSGRAHRSVPRTTEDSDDGEHRRSRDGAAREAKREGGGPECPAVSPSSISEASMACTPSPPFCPGLTVLLAAAPAKGTPLLVLLCSRCGFLRHAQEGTEPTFSGRSLRHNSRCVQSLAHAASASLPTSSLSASRERAGDSASGDSAEESEAKTLETIPVSALLVVQPPTTQADFCSFVSAPGSLPFSTVSSAPLARASGSPGPAGHLATWASLASAPFELLAWPARLGRSLFDSSPLALELKQNAAASRVAFRTVLHWARALLHTRALFRASSRSSSRSRRDCSSGAGGAPRMDGETSGCADRSREKGQTQKLCENSGKRVHKQSPSASPSRKAKQLSTEARPQAGGGARRPLGRSDEVSEENGNATHPSGTTEGMRTDGRIQKMKISTRRVGEFFRGLLAHAAAPVGLPSVQLVKETVGSDLLPLFSGACATEFGSVFPVQVQKWTAKLREENEARKAKAAGARGATEQAWQAADGHTNYVEDGPACDWWYLAHTLEDQLYICSARNHVVLVKLDLLMRSVCDASSSSLARSRLPASPKLETGGSSGVDAFEGDRRRLRVGQRRGLVWEMRTLNEKKQLVSENRIAVSHDRRCVAIITWTGDALAVLELDAVPALHPSSSSPFCSPSVSLPHGRVSSLASAACAGGAASAAQRQGEDANTGARDGGKADAGKLQSEEEEEDGRRTEVYKGPAVRIRRQNWLPLFRGTSVAFTDERAFGRQLVVAQEPKLGGRVFVLDWDSLFFQPSPLQPLPPSSSFPSPCLSSSPTQSTWCSCSPGSPVSSTCRCAGSASCSACALSCSSSWSLACSSGSSAALRASCGASRGLAGTRRQEAETQKVGSRSKKARRRAGVDHKGEAARRLALLAAHPATLAILDTPESRGVSEVVAVRRHSAFCCLLAPSSSRRQTSQCLASSCSSLPLSASSSASAVSSSSPFSLGASSASRPERETVPGGCGRTDDCLLFRVERGQCAAVPVVWQFDIFQQLLSFHEKHELRGEDLDGATAFFFRHFAREVCHTSWLKAEDALLRSRTHFVLSLPGASSSSSSPEASALSARGLEKDAHALKSTQRPLPVLLPICAPLLLAPHFSTPHSPVSRVSWLAARGPLETAGARGCLRRWEHLFWERPRESACGRRLRGKRDREGTWRGRGESDVDAVEKEPEKGGEKEANGGGETVQRDKEEIKHQSVQVMSEDENVTRETQQIQTMEEEEETDGTCTLDPASASLEELISALSQTPETQHEAASSRLSFATPSSSLGSVLPSTSSLSPTCASASSPQSSLCTQSHSSSATSSASSSSGMRRKRQPSFSRESLVACCEAKRCRQRGERRCRGREDGEEAKSSEIRVRRLGPPFLDFWLLQVATASEEAL
ncbi:hypothetical protein TGME49_259840 [Toxoplasma gondii ME49]|uniref:Uncharacterized protein n=2 Tax=Toxoplasma gondii TaxID=5811 RepID=A0A0F7UZ98_TOXGV|nr:hypothetical protein TGME49_259840 [Toxoplasma gondii ME49]EPT29457.1 hypothetical protein TGME49_259840 [Toxoplasma gondii ME49]ESS32007.1 hypothetical protein TGVEG_259840 [Toxoplasma gondii VEG]CEL74374.1 TPA: hypothetical protein BN1205_074500 [Toxoplasma gondii VEG]|eukprot:XP_018637053.1 hypothetical protein TGME49_259840 [Toxoplasma gondii ME49]